MNSKDEIVNAIKALHDQLAKYKVRGIGIFGSVVRGEQTKNSDIDVLVDFEDNADLLDLVGLGLFLEEKLGRRVDVVPRRALRKEIKDSILQEVVSA